MSTRLFIFITRGNLIEAADLLMSEGLAYMYSAKQKQIRVMMRNGRRAIMLVNECKKYGCKTRVEYEH